MRVGTLISGLLLVLLGEIFFLINLGYGSWAYIYEISKYWPVLLILIGLAIFWQGRIPRLLAYMFIIFAVTATGLIMTMDKAPEQQGTDLKTAFSISQQQYPEVKNGNLKVDYGGGKLSLQPGGQDLLQAEFNRTIKQDISADGQTLNINLSQTQYKWEPKNNDFNYWQLKISPDLYWDVHINAGAVDGNIDLTGVPFHKLNCSLGAGNILFILGSNGSDSKVEIDSGASNVKLRIVNDTGVRIRMNGALNSSNLDKLGWTKSDGYYISPNFEQAAARIDCDINLSLGNLDIEMQSVI